jgi:hypothetical protein
MIRPSVAAGVKEANDFSRVQVKTSNVRPLETVAMDTTEGEILKFCFASVLSRNDVIYLEGRWVKG